MNTQLFLQKLSQYDTSGFYSEELKLRAGRFVYGPDYTLLIEEKDQYTYPTHGWYYFTSVNQAMEYINIDLNDFNLDLPQEILDVVLSEVQ